MKFALTIFALSVMTLASAADVTKADYVKLRAQTDAALKARDSSFYEKRTTKDFVYINERGSKEARAFSIREMQGMMQMTSKIEVASKITKFAKDPQGSYGEVIETIRMTMKPGADKKPHVLEYVMSSREYVRMEGSVSKYFMIKALGTQSMKMDGKKFEAPKAK